MGAKTVRAVANYDSAMGSVARYNGFNSLANASNYNSQLGTRQSYMSEYASAWASQYAPREPEVKPTPDAVIRDQGFGGGEAKPRSRRYAKRAD